MLCYNFCKITSNNLSTCFFVSTTWFLWKQIHLTPFLVVLTSQKKNKRFLYDWTVSFLESSENFVREMHFVFATSWRLMILRYLVPSWKNIHTRWMIRLTCIDSRIDVSNFVLSKYVLQNFTVLFDDDDLDLERNIVNSCSWKLNFRLNFAPRLRFSSHFQIRRRQNFDENLNLKSIKSNLHSPNALPKAALKRFEDSGSPNLIPLSTPFVPVFI